MDSGSGSLQSSSGGDDQEYDSSRGAESISSFLNSSTHFASISNNPTQNSIHIPPQPPPPSSSFFDPNSSQHHHPLDHSSPFSLSHSPPAPHTTLYNNNNLDPVFWPKINQTILTTSQPGFSGPSPFPGPSTAARVPTPPDHHNVGAVAKNPKKRTRASRRAPTTVLTTDTSNFRQMVQEFTGIPAAPFSAGSSPFSRRLDLFGGGGGGSAMGVGSLYPLRPSAQKLQLSSQYNLSNSPSTTSPLFLNSDIPTTTTTTANNIDQGFSKEPQSLLNLQNSPLFSFQSLLQQQPLPNAATYSTKSDDPVGNSSRNNSLDGQEVNPNLGGGFPSSSSTTRWRDHQGGEDENLGPGFDSNSQNVRGYKLSSTDHFQSDKGLENVVVTSRGNDHQGNVDSWICPSD